MRFDVCRSAAKGLKVYYLGVRPRFIPKELEKVDRVFGDSVNYRQFWVTTEYLFYNTKGKQVDARSSRSSFNVKVRSFPENFDLLLICVPSTGIVRNFSWRIVYFSVGVLVLQSQQKN